ncbi:hypothetical protein [Desulforamulus hydrothermalis]|uniref:hypothetical protein n=1 Tax=Desulforamulus hydrothermalis TaxID=412895 RepID=UPI000915942B|nr:hypothetical protein [Desulforamulus hydrothermalis]SHH43868.1 hypothetical protein SAMN02745177_02560 [Desulforamulus hydrothermalis Lam5 = DSM 18033]
MGGDIAVIGFTAGIFTGFMFCLFALSVFNMKRNENMENEYYQCPHGYDDWDDCPDCCH